MFLIIAPYALETLIRYVKKKVVRGIGLRGGVEGGKLKNGY